MRKEKLSSFKIAGTYIGTIIGAGFATGQEILQFFSRFGPMGLLGLAFTSVMFILFGYIIMHLGKQLRAKSYMEIVDYSSGKFVGIILDSIITIFLFGALTAMLAGTGALFKQQFDLPSLVGNIAMAILTAVTVLTGINGVINSISLIVPFLLATVIGTSAYSIIVSPPSLSNTTYMIANNDLVTNWWLSAILYVSYNIVIAISVLGPLGMKVNDTKKISSGCIIGGVGVGIGSIMIYFALLGHIQVVQNLEVPMLFIASSISPIIQTIYAITLLAAIYTTSVGSLYGFVTRISKNTNKSKKIIIVITILALLSSQLGFSTLVKYLYPIVGYSGILLLLKLFLAEIKYPRGN